MLLTNAYKSIGFIQTAINQIVDDAFRNEGLIIDTKTLDTEELEQLRQALIDNGDIEAIKDAIRWGQLYGGGTVMAITDQNPELPLDEKQLKGKKLKFVASDRWHCTTTGSNIEISDKFIYTTSPDESGTTMLTLDRSRVGIFSGLKCPDHIRLIMQGWGLSIFEAVISPLTQYLKSMSVALELLDEAKIDVIKILDLANTLMTPGGEEIIKRRLALVTQNKNYKSSIAMDAQDDYQQKQITFSGLPDMIEKIQYLVCSALKRPYSKVFGKGSSGFSSGEDDLENYNTVVDSEIRTPATNLIKWVVDLRCLQLFGRKLPDFTPQWKPLRVMSEKDESEIKSRKMTDYLQLVDRQIMTKQQCAQHLTEDGIVLFSPEEISSISNEFEPNDYSNVEDLLMD
jgi:phage-related protein (TIGR01555 family)